MDDGKGFLGSVRTVHVIEGVGTFDISCAYMVTDDKTLYMAPNIRIHSCPKHPWARQFEAEELDAILREPLVEQLKKDAAGPGGQT